MTVYIVGHIDITDPVVYSGYEAGFGEIFRQYHGEFLAVDDDPLMLEGAKRHTRSVLVRFPDRAAALAWFRSDAYQELAAIRWAASTAEISLIEGVDEEDAT
jgi:uncharacterized protein (DUF1330 family)